MASHGTFGKAQNTETCVGCLGLCSGRQNHRHETRTRKGLSIELGPKHPKVYLWKLVRRLLARPVKPLSWVSYSGNLKNGPVSCSPFQTKRKQRESSGELWYSAWASGVRVTWELLRNADSYFNRIPRNPRAHVGLGGASKGHT